MRKFAILAAFLMLVSFGFSQNFSIDLAADKNIKQIGANNYEKLEMQFSYDGIHSFDVKTQKGEFSEISIPNTYSIGDLGTPKLPATKELIKVPFGAEVNVEVVSFDKETYKLKDFDIKHKIIPNQPSVSKSEDPAFVKFEYDEQAYSKNAFTDHKLATVEVLGTMRSARIARLVVAPVRYNPVKDLITVYNNIKVNVTFTNSDVDKTQELEAKTASPYFEVVYDKLVNHRSDPDDYPDHPNLTNYPIKYLVVADRMFDETLETFLEWKTMQGFTMEVAYTDEIGESYNEIQTWVHDQYNNSEITPSFLLLVGDIDQIPMEMGSSSEKNTDLYYVSVDGDYFPEMYYGRFSAQTVEQLQAMVDKTLYYEKYEFADPSYLDRVTLIAGADGTWNPNVGQPAIEYGTENYFNAAHGYATVNDYLTNYTGCYGTVDEGVGFINYTAHCNQGSWGNPNLTINDVYAFENENMYPLAVGNCCLSHDIGYSSECVGEAWMRKANGGAVAYIGSAPSTYWFEDFYWAVGAFPISGNNNGYVPSSEETTLGAYDAMFMGNYETVDAKIFVGNLAVTEVDVQGYPQHSSPLYYWQAYMCGGDPSLMLYNTQGEENTVEHMDIVPVGIETFEVYADPGSYVAISKDGILHGAALVDESGVVNVPIEPITSSGPVDIVVTGRQKIPYIVEVPAAALEGPYIVMEEAIVDDASANDNGQIDFGEVFNLDVTLKNVGVDDSDAITATVIGTDEFITVHDPNTADFGPIAADDTSAFDNAYTFGVTGDVPDEHTAQFELEMTDGTEVWTSSLQLTAYAPLFASGTVIVVDAAYGNNNGNLEPGETADLYFKTYNNGHADAPTTIANLSTTSDIATITSNVHNFGTFAAQSEDQAVFTIEIDESAEIGSSVELSYSVSSGNYDAADTYTLPVGLIIEDFESGDFSGFEWEHSGSADWFITESAYEGGFAAASGDVNDNQESVLEISGNVISDGTISFYRKVSSESGYDYLEFHIDGSEVDSWSGDVDWEMVEYDVSMGEHTFTWKYTKDGSVSNGDDMGWVDYITFPTLEMPSGPLNANIVASATEICVGDSVLLQANVSGGSGIYEYSWSPVISVSAQNASETWAFPATTTTYIVTVNDGTNEVSDEIQIIVSDMLEPPANVLAEETIEDEEVSIVWNSPGGFYNYDIIYDDGNPNNATAWNAGFEGNMNALKFTPQGYPCTLKQAKIHIWDGSWPDGDVLNPMEVVVLDDDGPDGLPGTELGLITLTPDEPNWVTVDLSSLDITINEGEFYIANRQISTFPDCPPTAIAEDTPQSRSYAFSDGSWGTADYDCFMIRTKVEGPHGSETLSYSSDQVIQNQNDYKGDVSIEPSRSSQEKLINTQEKIEASNERDIVDSKTTETYKVYRFLHADSSNTENWALLSENVEDTSYVDSDWSSLSQGTYQYAVKAVYNDVSSDPAYSNTLEKSTHFTPVWTGNAFNPMTFMISGAALDDIQLEAGDEIGIFDGDKCVGAGTLDHTLNPTNHQDFIQITAAKDDASGNGYTEGNPVIYKVWDSSAETEAEVSTVSFPYDPDYTYETFTSLATNLALLEAQTTIDHQTTYQTGWNMASFAVEPEENNLQTILQPIIDNGELVKVIDEQGNIIEQMPWGWVNNIGPMSPTEGYYIKVNESDSITTMGAPIALPYDIPLTSGWNMMGYPSMTPQDATEALAELMDNSILIKVIDEQGNIIENMPWGWVNNVGSFQPGEGYYIKVTEDATLTIEEPATRNGQLPASYKAPIANHFTPVYQGNPYEPMQMVVDAMSLNLKQGDELAIFSDGNCVGAAGYNPNSSHQYLTASKDDSQTAEQDGYQEGTPVILKVYHKDDNTVYHVPYKPIEGPSGYEPLQTKIVRATTLTTGIDGEQAQSVILYQNKPNPLKDKTIISYYLPETGEVSLNIVNLHGQEQIKLVDQTQKAGLYQVELDGNRLSPGIYLYQLSYISKQGKQQQLYKKMTIVR